MTQSRDRDYAYYFIQNNTTRFGGDGIQEALAEIKPRISHTVQGVVYVVGAEELVIMVVHGKIPSFPPPPPLRDLLNGFWELGWSRNYETS